MKEKNSMRKKTVHDYESSAKVVDGNLILSLPDAINPIVWRMELGSVKASALEVRPQQNGTFLLALKTPKGDVHDIAPYETRENAVGALMAVSDAMQNAQGMLNPASATIHTFTPSQYSPAPQQAASARSVSASSAYKWVAAIVGVIAIIVLFSYISSIVPQSINAGENAASSSTSKGDGDLGVPQSADQMLRGM